MKRFLLISFLFLCAAVVNAQVSLNAFAGYTFKDRISFSNANAYYNAAFQWGGSLEFASHPSNSFEIEYLRMDSHVPIYKLTGEQLNPNNTKTAINYILLGGNRYFISSHSKATPFIGAHLGVGILDGNGSSETGFAWDIKAGVKIHASSVVSIKLQAYLQSSVHQFGTDYWVDYWGNVYAVPGYKSLLQFGLGGALCFDFKKH